MPDVDSGYTRTAVVIRGRRKGGVLERGRPVKAFGSQRGRKLRYFYVFYVLAGSEDMDEGFELGVPERTMKILSTL